MGQQQQRLWFQIEDWKSDFCSLCGRILWLLSNLMRVCCTMWYCKFLNQIYCCQCVFSFITCARPLPLRPPFQTSLFAIYNRFNKEHCPTHLPGEEGILWIIEKWKGLNIHPGKTYVIGYVYVIVFFPIYININPIPCFDWANVRVTTRRAPWNRIVLVVQCHNMQYPTCTQIVTPTSKWQYHTPHHWEDSINISIPINGQPISDTSQNHKAWQLFHQQACTLRDKCLHFQAGENSIGVCYQQKISTPLFISTEHQYVSHSVKKFKNVFNFEHRKE